MEKTAIQIDECEALPEPSVEPDMAGNMVESASGDVVVVVDVSDLIASAGRSGISNEKLFDAAGLAAVEHVRTLADAKYGVRATLNVDDYVEPTWYGAYGRVLVSVTVCVGAESVRERGPSPVALMAHSA